MKTRNPLMSVPDKLLKPHRLVPSKSRSPDPHPPKHSAREARHSGHIPFPSEDPGPEHQWTPQLGRGGGLLQGHGLICSDTENTSVTGLCSTWHAVELAVTASCGYKEEGGL